MAKKKIKWEVTLGPKWEWLSVGEGTPGISQEENGSRLTGVVELQPNPDYWYPCARLVLQNVAIGDAMLRCFTKGDVFYVQAQTVAQKVWIETGNEDPQVSSVNTDKGISLRAEFV